jgi:hypothetical protein
MLKILQSFDSRIITNSLSKNIADAIDNQLYEVA